MTATRSLSSPADAPAGLGIRARRDAVTRTTSLALVWAALLWLTLLWEREGGLQDLGGWSDALLSTGRLTGLVASALLLVQVLMMARIPVLERAWGQDRLARQHLLVGFTSFNLMLTHIALITWGYAGGRLLGTLLSGGVFLVGGMQACLWCSALLAGLSWLSSLKLPAPAHERRVVA